MGGKGSLSCVDGWGWVRLPRLRFLLLTAIATAVLPHLFLFDGVDENRCRQIAHRTILISCPFF